MRDEYYIVHRLVVRPALLGLLLVYTAWLTVQNVYEDEFVDVLAPALTSVRSARYGFRYSVAGVMYGMLLFATAADCLAGVYTRVRALRTVFKVLQVLAELAIGVQLALVFVDLAYANTRTGACMDPLLCCVESVRTNAANNCANFATGPCSVVSTLAQMLTSPSCIAQAVLLIPLVIAAPLMVLSFDRGTK